MMFKLLLDSDTENMRLIDLSNYIPPPPKKKSREKKREENLIDV